MFTWLYDCHHFLYQAVSFPRAKARSVLFTFLFPVSGTINVCRINE